MQAKNRDYIQNYFSFALSLFLLDFIDALLVLAHSRVDGGCGRLSLAAQLIVFGQDFIIRRGSLTFFGFRQTGNIHRTLGRT